MQSNTTGSDNTAIGPGALQGNGTGNFNIALGYQAGGNLTTGDFNIAIGNLGVAGESRRIRIGTRGTQKRTFIAGISGATVPNGVGVIVNSNGQLGTVVSSERFKDEIKPMDKASEAILALKPVTFRYKQKLDPEGIPQFGLVAEDVAKVNPDLVVRDDQGKVYTVRYEAVNAMLLNKFLKEHRKNENSKNRLTFSRRNSKSRQRKSRMSAHSLKRANLRRRWSTIPKPRPKEARTSQSAATFHRVVAFCFSRYGSLKSPACWCVSITFPASS